MLSRLRKGHVEVYMVYIPPILAIAIMLMIKQQLSLYSMQG